MKKNKIRNKIEKVDIIDRLDLSIILTISVTLGSIWFYLNNWICSIEVLSDFKRLLIIEHLLISFYLLSMVLICYVKGLKMICPGKSKYLKQIKPLISFVFETWLYLIIVFVVSLILDTRYLYIYIGLFLLAMYFGYKKYFTWFIVFFPIPILCLYISIYYLFIAFALLILAGVVVFCIKTTRKKYGISFFLFVYWFLLVILFNIIISGLDYLNFNLETKPNKTEYAQNDSIYIEFHLRNYCFDQKIFKIYSVENDEKIYFPFFIKGNYISFNSSDVRNNMIYIQLNELQKDHPIFDSFVFSNLKSRHEKVVRIPILIIK